MEAATKRRMAAQEYVALERPALTKREFLNGDVFAMAGGTREHRIIATNSPKPETRL
ncbi:MAG: Uma2 family endonuclease [Verrucomicrobiales bacterium]|nr:Uma2 family endonuclease [Verrucomicrobiales bacterium]